MCVHQSSMSLCNKSERRVTTEQVLVLLGHKPLTTVATVLDLWPVQVDVDLGVTQGSPSITVGVIATHHYHWLLCHQVNGKLFVELESKSIPL